MIIYDLVQTSIYRILGGTTRSSIYSPLEIVCHLIKLVCPVARPKDGISIEFEIRSKFVALWFTMWSTDHNEILHTSQ